MTPISVLAEADDVARFDCGDAARNMWLQTRSLPNQRSDDTRTYVAREGSRVLGYYSLTVSSIVRGSLPGSLRRNAPDPVSCVLLAQLAVALQAQGLGLSRTLVVHAMGQACKIANIAGCRLFAVHSGRPELLECYAKFGFIAVQTTPSLMAMGLQNVRATVAAVTSRAGVLS